MNFTKVCSFLLLIAMSFSLVHDLAFVVLDEEHCSVKEYVSELTIPNAEANCDICNTHFEYHISYILPLNMSLLPKVYRDQTSFVNNILFASHNSFNFFKPPIV